MLRETASQLKHPSMRGVEGALPRSYTVIVAPKRQGQGDCNPACRPLLQSDLEQCADVSNARLAVR